MNQIGMKYYQLEYLFWIMHPTRYPKENMHKQQNCVLSVEVIFCREDAGMRQLYYGIFLRF